jgi:excisionase family DNA binding protein
MLLKQNEVAMLLGISERTVQRLRMSGKIPYIRLGSKTVRVRTAVIEQYLSIRESLIPPTNLRVNKEERSIT